MRRLKFVKDILLYENVVYEYWLNCEREVQLWQDDHDEDEQLNDKQVALLSQRGSVSVCCS